MKTLNVFVWINSNDFTADLGQSIYWNRCYLVATNLKSTASVGNIAVSVDIDRVNADHVEVASGTAPAKYQTSFIIASDDLHQPRYICNNARPGEPLDRLKVNIKGYNAAPLSSTPAFMLLKFECDEP